jgi:hypothetical protein
MRSVICAVAALVASASTAYATARVTIVFQFDSQHSERSVSEMKHELESQMRGSGVELNWRRLEELSASDSFPSVVVVTFHGSCEVKPTAPSVPSEPVVLAYSHISNGRIIPFADVECDHVRSSLGSNSTAAGPASELLFGRALGRVLAHELHHIIDQTRSHTHRGISRKSLSPRDLTADRI